MRAARYQLSYAWSSRRPLQILFFFAIPSWYYVKDCFACLPLKDTYSQRFRQRAACPSPFSAFLLSSFSQPITSHSCLSCFYARTTAIRLFHLSRNVQQHLWRLRCHLWSRNPTSFHFSRNACSWEGPIWPDTSSGVFATGLSVKSGKSERSCTVF